MKKRGLERGKVEIRLRNKKALSPVITTVLLIAMVIILAAIIFLWAKFFIGEAIEKEIGGVKKTAERFCPDVNFQAGISGTQLSIVNKGNVPIHNINIKMKAKGSSDITEYENAGELLNLRIGQSKPVILSSDTAEYDEVIIIPVLLGKSGNEQKKYPCEEAYGVVCVNDGDGN